MKVLLSSAAIGIVALSSLFGGTQEPSTQQPLSPSFSATSDLTTSEMDLLAGTFFLTGELGKTVAGEFFVDPFNANEDHRKKIENVAITLEERDPGVLRELESSARTGDLSGTREALVRVGETLEGLGESRAKATSEVGQITPTLVSIVKVWFWSGISNETGELPDLTPDTEVALDRLALVLVSQYES